MTKNSPIDQIRQKEEESGKKIAAAREKEEEDLKRLHSELEERLQNAQDQLSKENEQIIQNAKTKIEKIKSEGKAALEEEMAALDNIPEKKMSQAVEKVVNSLSA